MTLATLVKRCLSSFCNSPSRLCFASHAAEAENLYTGGFNMQLSSQITVGDLLMGPAFGMSAQLGLVFKHRRPGCPASLS